MRAILAVFLVVALVGAGCGPAGATPVADRTFRLPDDYRQWVFVGSSLGLSYSEGRSDSDTFHHVYLKPESYRHFLRHGTFPEKTVLMLELFEAADNAMPARRGQFAGRRVGLEAAVKDSAVHPRGWAYFSFQNGGVKVAEPFPDDRCFTCHEAHAATDNVFTQFYPVLRSH